MDRIHFALALSLTPGIGPVRAREILQAYPEPAAWLAERAPLGPSTTEWNRYVQEASRLMEKHDASGIHTLALESPDYPERLRHIPDAPCLLFVKGQASLNPVRSLGIVGTREASPQGLQWTQQWVQRLAPHGCAIVSGLARGIDTAAHQAALRAGLPTWAVLAHGLHTAHPAGNRALAEDILAQGGAWISEWPVGVGPHPGAYPRRNRLIAGLADGLWVVEAAIKSGAGITAHLAHQYDRPVFALPGRINDVRSQGCLDLIRRQVAQLVLEPSNLADELQWPALQDAAKQSQGPASHQRIWDVLHTGPLRIGDIERQTGLSSPQCLAALAEMLWLGEVQVQSGWYARA